MNFLHSRFAAQKVDTVEVSLDGQANVMLLDDHNFDNYKQGRDFRYVGGLAKVTPCRLSPPADGFWNLVVDLGGRSGQVRAGFRVLKAVQAVGTE